MRNIWFTGCTHYGHENIIQLAHRPFNSVQDMDAALIANHNACVEPGDIVYHLGDFAHWRLARHEVSDYLSQLNGRFVLVRGNHDPETTTVQAFRDAGHVVIDYLETDFDAVGLVLMHYPIEDWNGRFRGIVHLHAHTHSSTFRNPNNPFAGKHKELRKWTQRNGLCTRFCVGVEATGYKPVSFDAVLEARFDTDA